MNFTCIPCSVSNNRMKVICLRKVHKDVHVACLRIIVNIHNLLLLLLLLFVQEKKDKILRSLQGVWINQNLTSGHPKHPKQKHTQPHTLSLHTQKQVQSAQVSVLCFTESLELNKDIYVAQIETSKILILSIPFLFPSLLGAINNKQIIF